MVFSHFHPFFPIWNRNFKHINILLFIWNIIHFFQTFLNPQKKKIFFFIFPLNFPPFSSFFSHKNTPNVSNISLEKFFWKSQKKGNRVKNGAVFCPRDLWLFAWKMYFYYFFVGEKKRNKKLVFLYTSSFFLFLLQHSFLFYDSFSISSKSSVSLNSPLLSHYFFKISWESEKDEENEAKSSIFLSAKFGFDESEMVWTWGTNSDGLAFRSSRSKQLLDRKGGNFREGESKRIKWKWKHFREMDMVKL